VWDIDIRRVVKEYQAEIRLGKNGKKIVAAFPDAVKSNIQYGSGVRAHVVYLSQHQFIPYKRIQDYFTEQFGTPLSEGSIRNFIQESFEKLTLFEEVAKEKLKGAPLLHVDETGVNINSKNHWIHNTSNQSWNLFRVHRRRGKEALDEIGILENYQGIICHDFWKPYFRYEIQHALCNAHLLRELERAIEKEDQVWAIQMKTLLLEINLEVNRSGGSLDPPSLDYFEGIYKKVLGLAQLECPEPIKIEHKRGRIKRTKARNLLERLIKYQTDVLRFMEEGIVPFTNNLAERDLRMIKVHQKVSGCFRSMDGAKALCRIRSYISTCRKQDVRISYALTELFNGNLEGIIEKLN
jgi:transposase